MKHQAVLVVTLAAVVVVSACSDDDDGVQGGIGGTAGSAGTDGNAGSAGGGAAGSGGSGGGGGSMSNGGTGGNPNVVPPTPALPADAPTVSCPTVINGSLDTSDGSQTGRHSRIPPAAACGMAKGFPGNAADPTNPHLFDVYRFANQGATPVCFNFTLTYGANVVIADGGSDAGLDPEVPDTGADGGDDAASADASVPVGGTVAPAKYLTAYGTFFPTNLSLEYLADVGDVLTSPQTAGVTVPAGETIDVVVYAIDVAPGGVGSYTLSCSTL